MAIDLFGFTIGRNGKPTSKSTNGAEAKAASFVGPDEYDGSFTVDGGGVLVSTLTSKAVLNQRTI